MRKTKIIYTSLTIAIIVIIFSLPFIKIPISVSATGIVRPVEENTKVISLVSGRIISSRLATNNQYVKQGDTLLVIASTPLHSKRSLQNKLHEDYLAQLQDLNFLTNSKPLTTLATGLYQSEFTSMQIKLSELQTQIELAKKESERSTILYNDGVIPLMEYEKSINTHEQLQKQKQSIRDQQMATWHAKKREIEQHLRSSIADMEAIDIEEENYVVKASTSGHITNLQGFHSGNYLVQGQHLADISREDTLTAECHVPASSIGFIKLGQIVRFQIDTYNYNQWGMLKGKVTDINNNVMINEQTGVPYLIVRCDLDKNYLSLKNGYRATVGKGNTFTARFYLTERTLWQLLFDRMDNWFNPHLQ
ncbi:HlyD family efflux transporter periplasmic adaptor subunit [Sphingobacterium oryzagri]|uniref:HlyD family efflux transporter periplasmic adaptor subunit n=1 Tax=Sphingobacterium oryzagri TaxID=3025669 RepID=A0ABY7WIQ0_9SPHI|nr:HlyD family efflux transporter periplasmic adaptor subunit [Sphingobacterium sp. KACC 22765]WDF69483.1 HlyD family efflux transporter periplasmic adaptor subunit [Sphingobacterium sp. KACC 22765]